MILNYERSFLKDIKKLKDKKIAQKLKSVLCEFENIENVYEAKNIKKLKGHEFYYRVKIGNYRLGVSLENNGLNIIRFLHRKDIYKWFP